MAKFKIGEIVIIVYTRSDLRNFIGHECTILNIGEYEDSEIAYQIDIKNEIGEFYWAAEFCFKKKPFKGEEDIMKLFTSLDNSGNIKADKIIEEEIV